MRRALPLLLLASSCLDFERRVANCFDGGVCAAAAGDAGLVDGGPQLAPFDAGFFCTERWCWESPFPHGVSLNAVFADGDDLVVVGEHSMLAERRGGQWRSFQSRFPAELEWQSLWGTSRDDVWLAGDARVWHRTATDWSPVGSEFMGGFSQGVTGSDAGVFASAGGEVFQYVNDSWSSFARVQGADVPRLVTAFGAVHGSVRLSAENAAGSVKNFEGSQSWAFDGGATFSFITSSTGLIVTGSRTVRLDEQLQLVFSYPDVLVAGVEANRQLYGATYGRVGRFDDRGLQPEFDVTGVRAMAAGRSVVAVGERGLLLERRDGGWVDTSGTATWGDVVSFVELDGGLFGVTSGCELLQRGTAAWTKRSLLADRCLDAASDGTSLTLLTPTSVVSLDGALAMTGIDRFPSAVEPRRLWRSEGGALVITTSTEVFFRSPSGPLEPLRALCAGGSWGVSGRGSVARICGLDQDKVADVDLGRSPPVVTEVPGLLAHDCHAVLALKNGSWALAARGGGDRPRLRLVNTDGLTTDVVLDLQATFIEAFVETPTGIAVASDRFAFVPFATKLVESPIGFGGIRTLAVFHGRLFAGGARGSILQTRAP